MSSSGNPRRVVASGLGGLALAGAVAGFFLLGRPQAVDFDARLRQANGQENGRREVAIAAATVHPTDYLYPLVQSLDEPLRSPAGTGKSPRLVALGRAARLCPRCDNVHAEIARALWELGLRRQSLLEWRLAFELSADRVHDGLGFLVASGATADELASIRPRAPGPSLVIAQHLFSRGDDEAAKSAANWAIEAEADRDEIALAQASRAVVAGRLDEAETLFNELRSRRPRDVRPLAGLADVLERRGQVPEALALVERAAALHSVDLGLARARVRLVVGLRKWESLESALDALKAALRAGGHAITEAYLTAGGAHMASGNGPRALRAFQTATTLAPESPDAWRMLAGAAHGLGNLSLAEKAFRGVARLLPSDPQAAKALAEIASAREALKLRALVPEAAGLP